MNLFKPWPTISLSCLKNGVIDRIDETYDEFLENQKVQAKVKELWKD